MLQAAKAERKKKLEREIEEEMGDDYVLDLKKNYDIEGDQKYDIIPEFWEGHNVADYIDPEIFEKLNALEQEEDMRIEAGIYDYKVPELTETMKEIQDLAKQIREKKIILKDESRVNKQSTKPVMPRTAVARGRDRSVSRLRNEMEDLGVDMEDTENVSYNFLFIDNLVQLLYDSNIYIKLLTFFRHISRKRGNEADQYHKT